MSALNIEYYENISRKALEKYQNLIRKYARNKHGIYSLYSKDKLYYVGLASDLRNRLTHHLKDRHANSWDTFSVYLTTGPNYLRELEALLLRVIDKKGNRQKGKFYKAENLKKEFRNDLKKEVENIFKKRGSNFKEVPKKLANKVVPKKFKLKGMLKKRLRIKFNYKNHDYRAYINKSGSIVFNPKSYSAEKFKGKIYSSLSTAASAVTNKPMNGWKSWKYKNGKGEWNWVDKLRKNKNVQ